MNENFTLSNLVPDKIDNRDHIFSSVVNELPKKIDYLTYVDEIENQLNTGSCVANATASALELLSLRNGIRSDYSRLFLYFNLRDSYSELKNKDNGSYLRDGFKMVNKFGIPDERFWEFDVNNVNIKPTEEAFSKAVENKVNTYERILINNNTINTVKTAIFNGYPIIFAIMLDKSFYNIGNSFEKQNYNGTNKNSDVIGSHAMSIVGYDDDLQSFYVENSWGASWGKNGVFLLKYDVFLKDCHDIWCCTSFKDFKMDAKMEIKKPSILERIKNFFKNYKENAEQIIFLIIGIISFSLIVLSFLQ